MKTRTLAGIIATTLIALAQAGCGGGGSGEAPTQPPPGNGNHNPTVNLSINNVHLAYGGSAQATVSASDIDGDQVTFTWTATLGTVASSGSTATNATFTAGRQWGQATITVTASDGRGGSTQATAQTYIRNPAPPGLSFSRAVPTSSNCNGFALQIGSSENVTLTNVSIDPCGFNQYYAAGLNLTAGTPYVIRDPGCVWYECSGTSVTWYNLMISGRRAEPDGGTFGVECTYWNPLQPGSCD